MSTDIGLGELLRRLRTERGEPLRVVAAAAGIDSTLLSRIERGERLPTPPQLKALTSHFELPDDELESLGDAARLMRTWGDADTVLRAADVIEARTAGDGTTPFARARISERNVQQARPRADAVAYSAALDTTAPSPRAVRAEMLEEIEEAALAGSEALDRLETAARDGDTMVALRAAELLRQLRSRLA